MNVLTNVLFIYFCIFLPEDGPANLKRVSFIKMDILYIKKRIVMPTVLY